MSNFPRIDREWLAGLAVGDEVTRVLAGVVPMRLRITAVSATLIVCGAWEFDRATGAEVDADLGWGPDRTGSYLTREDA